MGRELNKKKKRNENKIQRKCEKRKRRQADKQMKFINMLLITPDNGHDRVKGEGGNGALCCVCILHTNCQINEQNTTAVNKSK